jgi:transposase-like protein
MARGEKTVTDDVAEVLAKRPWDEEDARVALDEYSRSGLSQGAFARQHGFSRERLTWWRKKLGVDVATTEPVPELLPVRVVSPVARVTEEREPAVPEAACSGVEVIVGGTRRVRVAVGFDAETLYRVVEVLEVEPC